MSGELMVPAGLLDDLAGRLAGAASGLEDTASSAPSSVDAGQMTAMIAGMIGALTDSAATVSEALTAMGAQVRTAGADFWGVDEAAAAAYAGRLPDGH